MVDIDHFKKINDDHGHGVGDKVLKMVAKLLDSKFGNKTSICRYGGEEFCVLLPGTGLEPPADHRYYSFNSCLSALGNPTMQRRIPLKFNEIR